MQGRSGFTKEIPAFVLVLLSVLLQWYSHRGGLLMTDDSCNYLSAAASFRTNFTFLSFDGEPYLHWPPLFPVVLSFLSGAWYWIQLALTAWIGVLVIIETRKLIEDPWMQFTCQASILLGVHLLMIGTFLWSELLFLLLLFYFIKTLEKDQFVAAIILGFFLCLQRNAGLFFVIGAALWYWDLKKSIILFVVSTSGFWAWNYYVSVARDYTYFQSIPHNFVLMSDAFMKTLAPVPGIALLLVVILMILKREEKTRLISFMLISYFVCLVIIFPIDIQDTDRFVAIVVPFFMMLVFRSIEIAAAKQTSIARKVLLVLVICWLAYPLSRTVKNALQWHKVSFTSYFCAV